MKVYSKLIMSNINIYFVVLLTFLHVIKCDGQDRMNCQTIIDSTLTRINLDSYYLDMEKALGDSIMLYFEHGFDGTEVKVTSLRSSKVEFEGRIYTDASTGLAKSLNIGLGESELNLQIGDCSVPIDHILSQFIFIRYKKDGIIIGFYDHMPYYD